MARAAFDTINWQNWSFSYHINSTDALTLTDGWFRTRKVFQKLSLPVIRVKYSFDAWIRCGPYNDQINQDNLVRIRDCGGGSLVCVREVETADGTLWLQLSVYARIGKYHLFQCWWLSNKGDIIPQLLSKGLACKLDHWHHPYWRFDFDVDGPGDQRVSVFDGKVNKGFFTTEGILINSKFADPRYCIQNLKTGMSVWINPPKLDLEHGIVGPDSFSKFDGYLRQYRRSEDIPWPHPCERDISFAVHETIVNKDIVFWSICHLFHRADEGKDHWHAIGPRIIVHTPPNEFPNIYPDPQDTAMRAFRFSAEVASKQGFVGGFPNFYEATYNNQRFAGTIFVKAPGAIWLDVPLSALGNPPLGDFQARFRATNDYATSIGYIGGFPNFFHADYGLGTVCGTVLIKPWWGAEWRDVPLSELGNVDLNDIGARFRASQDYAKKHGFVGAFPNFHHANYGDGRGIVCGTVLLNASIAQWQDVFLYKLPF